MALLLLGLNACTRPRQELESLFLQHSTELATAEATRVKVCLSSFALHTPPFDSHPHPCSDYQACLRYSVMSGTGLGQVHRMHTPAERRRLPLSAHIHAGDGCSARQHHTGAYLWYLGFCYCWSFTGWFNDAGTCTLNFTLGLQACLSGCENVLTVMKECQEVQLISQQLKHEGLAVFVLSEKLGMPECCTN